MNPNAYRDYQFVKGGDFDTPSTIIEAVREYRESFEEWYSKDHCQALAERLTKAEKALRALRLPPVEEARRD